jgi:hypothetical protein
MPIATHIYYPDGSPRGGFRGGEERGEEERGEQEMGEVVCLPLGFPSVFCFCVGVAHYPRVIYQDVKMCLFPIALSASDPLPSFN